MRKRWATGGLLACGLLMVAGLAGPSPAMAAETCRFLTVTITGTSGDDTIVGTPGNDVILAGAGNDTVMGLGGNDTACLGAGDDSFDGGPGDDMFVAENVADGADTFVGGDAGFRGDLATYAPRGTAVNVSLDGNANDGQTGEGDNIGQVNVEGSAADDVLTGDLVHNFLNGMEGADRIDGRGGDDELWGNAGNDTLIGGPGNDFVFGMDGNDRFDADSGPDGADVFEGGFGLDEASYRFRSTTVLAALDGVANDGALGEGDDIRVDVENLTGGSAGDRLSIFGINGEGNGRIARNILRGGPGQDILIATDLPFISNDAVDGGPDVDVCSIDEQFDVKVNCEL
ncbi:calcium-binding protein [Flindersiella endophytica]